MNNISGSIIYLFVFVVVLTIVQFYRASGKSVSVLIFLVGYAIIQSLLAIYGFYKVESSSTRFVFLLAPGLLTLVGLCSFRSGKKFLDGLNVQLMTLLHSVRLPIEIVLYYVFVADLIPELMTFEGYNIDIVSGISAPFIYYFVFISQKAGAKLLLAWNIICLLLLINVVSIALLSAQTPFQQLAFNQPNVAITYFPFVLLPAIIVPAVLTAHVAVIRRILQRKYPFEKQRQ